MITSVHNERILAAARLRERRGREAQGRIVIDGGRELGRALAAGVEVLEVFVDPGSCTGIEPLAAVDAARSAGIPIVEVAPAALSRIAFGDRNEGLVGIATTPDRSLSSLVLPQRPLVGVLEGVEKPGNVGAITRSADGAGVDALVVADAGTDLFNPNTIRASVGTIFSLPVCVATTADVLAWLRQQRLAIVVARVDGAVPYTDAAYGAGVAIVLGSETAGLSDAWNGIDVTSVRIPMRGVADSLNVSVTAAVLFYEAIRQRSTGRLPSR